MGKKTLPWHGHELTLHGENSEPFPDDGAHHSKSCRACALPIFTTPTYVCLACEFCIHRTCADLALTGSPEMELRTDVPAGYDSLDCKACSRKPDPNSYLCINKAGPKSFTHFFCTFHHAIGIRHRSHPHDLIALCGGSYSFLCGACGDKRDASTAVLVQNVEGSDAAAEDHSDRGEDTAEKKQQKLDAGQKSKDADNSSGGITWYVCNICGYWLHKECASLRAAIRLKEHKSHALRLTSVPPGTPPECVLCHEKVTSPQAYFCSSCQKDFYAHITCAAKNEQLDGEVPSKQRLDAEVKYLPLTDDFENIIAHLKKESHTNKSDDSTSFISEGQKHKKTVFKEVLHDHDLILESDENENHVCNACVQTIHHPNQYYRCNHGCTGFFLHATCVELLEPTLQHRAHPDTLELLKRPRPDKLLSLFTCRCCGRESNGFAYACRSCGFYLDVICASLPKLIVHGAGHNRIHELTLRPSVVESPSAAWLYNCKSCNFALHAKCALLPETARVEPEFDQHLLRLVTSIADYQKYSSMDHFCEVCQGRISDLGRHTRHNWYYSCDQCDQSFHVECVPSVSPVLSKVRFGDRIRVGCHHCDVVSIRMLTLSSHKCGVCTNFVHGRRDEMAFRCSECAYWMHYECAEKNWVRT